MFDVFYIGKKPNLFPHERACESIAQAQTQSRTRFFWIVNYLCDYGSFDFLWEPPPWQANQRHAWSSRWQQDSGTYLVPKSGYVDTNYHELGLSTKEDLLLWENIQGFEEFDFTWHPDYSEPAYIYQFGTQWQKTGGPRYTVPGAQDIKYVVRPRAKKITKDPVWEVPAGIDHDSFDWTWHPDDTDPPYIYQFGTQHQRTGGPKYITAGATDVKYVEQIKIKTQRTASAVYLLDHLDGRTDAVKQQVPVDRTLRYFDNYLDTLKRVAAAAQEHEFIWIISSVCDYSDFDFSWHPEQWQAGMLHVFASGDQKFGDTFFMHVPTFLYRADRCQLLEWYDVNFVQGRSVPRWPLPEIIHEHDSQVGMAQQAEWAGPLVLLSNRSLDQSRLPMVNLWREKTKTIVPLDRGGAAVIIPRVSVPFIKQQIYDYPHIDKEHRSFYQDHPLDVVFISNGEHGADHHWHCLLNSLEQKPGNRVHRVDGVNGRVAAYQAAARASKTPWFFAVFAKLQVNEEFDWTWQPDRLQQPKHYIFHAYNPVNDLVYGHQAMIAYNVRMTLANTGQGLDFTLDQPHEVVPEISGTAYYDNDPWTCWRTAFREALKLRHSLPDVENEYRLQQWLDIGKGVNGHWSTTGAHDAMRYYDQVQGDFVEIKKSYEWSWLASYALVLHPQLFTQSKT